MRLKSGGVKLRGIKHNLHLLNNFFVNYYPDILIFSESWSTPIDVNLYVPDNYTLISYYCRTNSIRGGVSIHYKSDLQHINFKKFEISCCVEKIFEACCCYLKVGKKYIVVLGIYRSPSSNTYAF
jgi:hypothetical protein